MKTNYDILIIGGGVSGLTVGWHLKKAGLDVGVLEAGPDVGGCTQTPSRSGFLLEKGPFNVMVRDPAFEELLDQLADDVSVVSASKSARDRFIYRNGSLLKVPSSPISLLTAPVLSLRGRLRLVRGLFVSSRASGGETTIRQAATRRFGEEVADTLVSALISGVLGGDTRRLSLDACFPSVAKTDREARSMIGYGLSQVFAKKKKGRKPRKWRGLVSFESGLGSLMDALAKPLGGNLQVDAPVDAVRKVEKRERGGVGSGFEIEYTQRGKRKQATCSRLVMATPHHVSAELLSECAPNASNILRSIDAVSLVVMNLAYKREQVAHPLNGFGFLVPQNEPDFPLMGVLWSDSIFPHHAPSGYRLIRVFCGGTRDPKAIERSDDELIDLAGTHLSQVLGIEGKPHLADICRHRSAIPQYHLGHRERTDRLLSAIGAIEGLDLVGNYLEGVSLNDCVRLATKVAGEIVQSTPHSESEPIDEAISCS